MAITVGQAQPCAARCQSAFWPPMRASTSSSTPQTSRARVALSWGKADLSAPWPKPGNSASTQRHPSSESSGSSLRQWKPVSRGEHNKSTRCRRWASGRTMLKWTGSPRNESERLSLDMNILRKLVSAEDFSIQAGVWQSLPRAGKRCFWQIWKKMAVIFVIILGFGVD